MPAIKNRKYAAFDLETSADIPKEEDWRDYRPLGITCAALCAEELGEPLTWFGTDSDRGIADLMTPQDLGLMVRQLQNLTAQQGFTLVTWNGLGFDFDVLGEESGMPLECAELALNHIDMMFQIFCKKGYPIGLDTAAQGLGIGGKTEGMDGGAAVRMWQEGDRQAVIEYCAQDVRATLGVAQGAERAGSLSWNSKSGRNQSLSLRAGWLTVRQSMKLSRPNTTWMDDPIPREQFTQWLREAGASS